MTPEQKHLVQTSFEQVKPIAHTAATLFYGCLFNLDPNLETLFKGDLDEQGRKLMHMIGLAVKGLNRLDELVPLLRQMGARHAGYGVTERDYETVGDALLWALELGLGDEFTPAVKEAWIAVYELLAETMKAGAREALIVTAAPLSNEATTSTGGDRNGWRGYFPAANKPSKKRETEMRTEDNYETITGRFATTIVTLVMLIGLLFLSSAAASAAVITVTGASDTIAVDGIITLREAITAANTNQPCGDAPAGDPGLDTIKFDIAGSGVQTIALTSALPPITEPITIDGYSQKPCASNPAPCSRPNTLAVGSDAVLLIELNGAGAGASASGLFLNAGNSTVTGLVINRFGGKGIYISANGNNVIAGNFIGTNAGGTASLPSPNNIQGILIITANNVIGGTLPADRNVLSGNGINGPGGTGVWIDGASATGNKVIGNYIGTSASGMVGVPNFNMGVVLNNTKLNIIGGVTAVERNLISSNGRGISIGGTASNNQIQGNYVGPKADGTGGLGGGTGIVFSGTASNNTIGGAQAGAGNVIAFNSGPGVLVSALNVNNAISGNAIFGNDPLTNYLGIDLFSGGYGVTLNDDNTGDADTGANNLQNFPLITSALANGATTTIQGTLDSAFSSTFRIELFSNNACDASGFGEGQNYLGFVNLTTDASGKGTFIFNVPTASVVGGFFTATATDANGNTSEFSACGSGVVASPGTLQLSTNQVQASESVGSVGINVTRTNGSTGTVTVHYATLDGTAQAPSDYTATSGTITFNDGETVKPIAIPVNDDSTPEGSEYFSVTLTSPTGGAVLGNTSSAKFFIQDNELPKLSINDVSVSEGDQGAAKLTFTVTLSNPVNGQILVDFATTAGGTAATGVDFQSTSGTLAFNSGETVKHIDVFVNGDTLYEPDETLFVKLSSPQSATIAKAQGVGTIVNDDPVPPAGSLQFSGASFNSKEDGGQTTIVVTRTGGSYGAVSVQYATVAGGTASPGSDYAAVTGTLSWADGDSTDKTFTVAITDDFLNEPNESINLVLNNPAGAQLGAPAAAVLNITDNDAQPGLSLSDVSLAEGNSGTTNFVFNVSLSAASGQTVTADYSTSDGSASAGSDYQPVSGTLTFNPGETSKSINVQVNGDTTIEPDKTFLVNLSNPGNAALSQAQATGTIINDDAPAAPTLGFNQANYIVPEQLGVMTLTVTRSGDTSAPASVDYTTNDVSATQKSDYEITAGTLNFASGEASKTIQVLLNQDMYIEGNESFNVLLSNPKGASLGQASAQVTITDDLPESAVNVIDDAQSFVYMHYHDFLNREPDQPGLQFWTNSITACGQDAACLASARVNVSAAYFLSIEFQQTGFLLHLMQKESFGGLPKYAAFMRDLEEVSRGVVVNSPGWEQKLANNQEQFAEKWVNRPEFKALYDGLSNDAYVNALYAHAGIAAPKLELEALVSELDAAPENRAKVLLDVAASAAFRQQEQNSAFVLMQYFGYLRRDPDSGPDSDLSGYYFWLQKLNSFNGDYQKAEMVKAFLDSLEYRGRFGQ